MPRQAAHTASYQQSAERTGRIHVIAQRRVHVRLGRLQCCSEDSLPVAPGVLRARQVTACALQRLDSVEEIGQRLVGYNGGLALDKHAITRSHGRKLHGLHPVVKQEQQPARACKLLLQKARRFNSAHLSCRALYFFNAARMVTKFFSDLLIFRPSMCKWPA